MENLKSLTQKSLPSSFLLPKLCDTTSLLYLILATQLCVFAWELSDQNFDWIRISYRSLAIQWITLASAAVLCQVRPYLHKFSLLQGWLLCFIIIESIGLSVLLVGHYAFGLGGVTVFGLFQQGLALAIISAMVLRFFQLQEMVVEQGRAELSSRMDALQARIKPHFLFNSLNTIAELVQTKPDAAELAVENLASLFRANLREKSSFCTLQQELTLVKGYLALEKWRLSDRLIVEWQESVTDYQWPVPVLCLQPIVENAVVHGVASKAAGGVIQIAVLQTPLITTLSVENPIGSDGEFHSGHGVGLDNVQRRLNVLYGEKARCRIERTSKNFKVIITLPKHGV